MKVLAPDDDGLAAAAAQLRSGGLVGMPTETVYGLAAVHDDPAAVARVFAAKERPTFDPLIVHIAARDALDGLVRRTADVPWGPLEALLGEAWPGPLTVVLPRQPHVLDLVTAGLPTVAVRCPDQPVALALLGEVGPVVAPSANRFGRISPTEAAHVVSELGDRVRFVLDGGRCPVGVESTIIGFEGGSPVCYRPGGFPLERVVAHLGPLGEARGAVVAPGMLPSHYAPRTPVMLDEDRDPATLPRRVAVLRVAGSVRPSVERLRSVGIEVVAATSLSVLGDPPEAAHHLFAALRELDDMGADCILADLPPWSTGLGHAIADRLRRAAG